ncbi:histamine H3 receptor-like [Tubulanus polymorphus]|uniref:histamine H3 receptor-like n=1 Tax=Tubulanus polymorphus TaxID=672921 RepID=UPI003DA38EE5
MISLDRYWSVSQAIAYKHKQTTRLVLILMIVPWVVGVLVYAPAIIFWDMWTGKSQVPIDECFVEFHNHTPYLLFGAIVEFIIPFLLVSMANVCIYAHIRRRTRSRSKASKASKNLLKTETTSIGTNSSFSNGCTYDTSISVMTGVGSSSPSPCRPPTRNNRRLTKDKKTAKAIAIIIVVFGACWAPYQIMALIRSICSTCLNEVAFEIAFWLLWFNSMINPILYPFTHIKFRQAFQKILCRQKYRRKNARVHVVHATSSGNGC